MRVGRSSEAVGRRGIEAARSTGICAAVALVLSGFAPTPLSAAATRDAPASPPAPAAPRPSWRILLFFDEARDTPADIQFEESARSAIARDVNRRLEFFSEYLDSSRIRDERFRALFFDYLREKYDSRPPDVVLAFAISSPVALAGNLRETLPGVPIVFARFDPAGDGAIPAAPGVTGIVGRADPGASLDLVRRLLPGAKKLFLLAGDAPVDRQLTAHMVAEAAQRPGLPPLELLEGLTFDQLRHEVTTLPEDAALLTTTFFRDVSGESFRGVRVVEDLSARATVPLFVLAEPALGAGTVGGAVLSIVELGERAAGMAVRILAGTAPESIPVEILEGNRPMFDARALTRWRIPDYRLPPGSEIRFRPIPIWKQYPVGSALLAAILTVQSALISALFFERNRARRAEASLQAQTMQLGHLSRVSLLGTISASLAHELNQPLAAILANTQAGLRFLQRPSPDLEELRAILADSARDAKRAGGVITSLRSMLRHHEREAERVDLGDLTRDTVALLRSELLERRVAVALRLSVRTIVPADRGQIQQVVLNLILNAAEAMADLPDGRRRVEISIQEAPGGAVRTVVADSGPGVPPERIETIFDSFWTTKPHGMGMGLAICRTIVDQHGGRIWVENGSRGGARFCFDLPPAVGRPVASGAPRGPKQAGAA